MHGYELRKRLNLMLGWGRVLSYGSLYPALKKMLRANLISEAAATTTTSRRPRIVYEVTEAGHEQFQRLMSEVGPSAWEDDTFDIRFAFFSSHRHGDPSPASSRGAAHASRSASRASRPSSNAPRPRSTAMRPSSNATAWSRSSGKSAGSRT